MADTDESKDAGGRVFTTVNHQALDTWLRFGTTRPLGVAGHGRTLQGAELLRWAHQRIRQTNMLMEERKKGIT